ncbi:LysR family transcriptional regulator [Streptomyces sp. NPDC002643]
MTHDGAGSIPGENLRKFDLNLLVALDALLRYRNVTRAGERLNLTQSTMSSELRRLRRMFDDELLVRVGREYELTALARDLVEPVADVLARIERAVGHRTSFDPGSGSRTFSIAMSDYSMFLLLQPLLRRVGIETPGVTVEVHPLVGQIQRMVGQDGIDLVIGPAGEQTGVRSERLFSDRFVCIVSADHPEVGDRMTTDLFESLPQLTIAWPQPRLRTIADEYLDNAGLRRHVVATTRSFALAPHLVRGTRLVALVQERLAHELRETTGIRILEPPFSSPGLEEMMYWNAAADGDPAHAWLRRMIAETARTMSGTQVQDTLASATEQMTLALASLGEAYELLDDTAGDRLEKSLFRPVQLALGRTQRAHTAFAAAHDLPSRSCGRGHVPQPSADAKARIERAVTAAERANTALAELQGSMLPVDVDDPGLLAALSEIREHLDHVCGHAGEFVRTLNG